jgi:regulatory protein
VSSSRAATSSRGASSSRAAAREASAEALAADPVSFGREICLRALTAAPRSRGELAQAMRRKGVPDDAAAEVLHRLSAAGLVDDAAFADAWVSSRHEGRGLARRALAGELHRKGVDNALVQTALSQVGDEDEVVAAAALVRRRLAGTAGLPMPARVRRLTSMLARKGYSGGVASRVVRDALGAEAAELLEAAEQRSL